MIVRYAYVQMPTCLVLRAAQFSISTRIGYRIQILISFCSSRLLSIVLYTTAPLLCTIPHYSIMKLTAITILYALGVTAAQLECREFTYIFFIITQRSFVLFMSKTNANVVLPTLQLITANSIDLESWTEISLQSGLTFKYAVVVSRACIDVWFELIL